MLLFQRKRKGSAFYVSKKMQPLTHSSLNFHKGFVLALL